MWSKPAQKDGFSTTVPLKQNRNMFTSCLSGFRGDLQGGFVATSISYLIGRERKQRKNKVNEGKKAKEGYRLRKEW